jgi:hypothetical protein
MMPIGYAPTQDIPRVRTARPVTAPSLAVPSSVRPGTLVEYHGTSFKDHGNWVFDGPCPCRCGGLRLWRRERDGLHRLVHVSAASVSRRYPW